MQNSKIKDRSTHRDASFQQEGSDLIDDASALAAGIGRIKNPAAQRCPAAP